MIVEPRTPIAAISRRSLLLGMALAPLPALMSCRTRPSGTGPNAADAQLQRFADSHAALARREPNLPGIRSLAGVDERLFAGFGSDDTSLLAAALYLQARDRIASRTAPLRESDVRAALSKPIDLSRYGRPYLERTLADARGRLEAQPEYRRQVEGFRQFPPGAVMCRDVDTGATYSLAMCAYLLDIGVFELA